MDPSIKATPAELFARASQQAGNKLSPLFNMRVKAWLVGYEAGYVDGVVDAKTEAEEKAETPPVHSGTATLIKYKRDGTI